MLAAMAASAAPMRICYDPAIPQLRFAAAEIRSAAGAQPVVEERCTAQSAPGAGTTIILAFGAEAPKVREAYRIRKQQSGGGAATYTVFGADPTGAMYGGLDLAEAVRLNTLAAVADSEHTPYIARRGIKFNIPLDLRTPSYSDSGDAAQQNIPEMWSFDFWRDFLDDLARHRYNVLTLWNLHPFPSMVKVPEYPDIALDDVQRTTAPLDDTFSHTGSDMVRPAMLRSFEVVKKMSIEDKIRFWRDVMQYARDRGIETYVFTWNTFVWGTGGKHGITIAQNNPVTIDYFRKSVREMVLTYPLLAGIGITAGEQMENRKDEFSSEKWLWKTYGEGIGDALSQQPGREFRLIHRFHQTVLGPIQEEFRADPSIFEFSYKYSVAHMYSDPAPVFGKETIAELPKNTRLWMTVRNDDIYSYRWGDPAYARTYIRNLPGPDKLAGFYMGPDGYVWGRDFASTEPETPRELVIRKQWYSFMLWGRLSYDPALPDSLFQRTLAIRFPQVDAATLFAASSTASRIIPQITRFFWGDIDLKWFPEACLSHPKYRGFFTVKHFAEGESMPGAGVLSIRDYRAGKKGVTPIQVAEALRSDAAATLKLVAALRPAQAGSKELRLTLGDYEAMAWLGNYYAEKILGALDLAEGKRESSVSHLEAALGHWKKYAAVAGAQYRPQLLNRVGYVDLNKLGAKVEADIELARQ
jgi:hypothetical protein